MHECPICGYMCDCDGEDLFYSLPPEDCSCSCQDEIEVICQSCGKSFFTMGDLPDDDEEVLCFECSSVTA